MIDRLRIKCPSCGLFLDVTNSRHEAVKTITCPGCKKRLSVDFQEKPTPKPITPFYYGEMPIALHEGLNNVPIPDCAHLEINVVRLSDGGSKCIVRPLSADHPVTINNTQLELEDKAVLDEGDQVKIGKTILKYGKGEQINGVASGNGRIIGPAPTPNDTEPSPEPRSYKWLIGFIALVVAAGLVVLLWPKGEINTRTNGGTTERVDSPLVEQNNREPVDSPLVENDPEPTDTPNIVQPVPITTATPQSPTPRTETGQGNRVVTPPPPVRPSYSNMSDYDLELQARDDVKAQYEYGKRLIARGDSTHLVLGINYLKMAIRNGSNDARQALQNTYNSLEQKAANGNRVAENILREQR